MSFRDRTEPGGANPYGGHPLTGWNHVQAGAELPIHLAHLGGFSSTKWAPPDADLYFVPSERTPITFQIHRRARTETNGGAAQNSRLPFSNDKVSCAAPKALARSALACN